MLTVELHCHTIFSKDSLTQPEALLAACRRKGLDRVAITDHNTIRGALKARELDPTRVIVGEEIKTSAGELLAFFVQEEVPAGLPPLETIALLRSQGAFISVSHPFDRYRGGHWLLPDLLAITPLIDAIETFNARCINAGFNLAAQDFARQHGLPGTAGSDAHAPFELGRARLRLPDFGDAASFKSALAQAEFQAALSPPWVHFFSSYASWVKSRRSKRAS